MSQSNPPPSSVGKELLDVPLPEMIQSLGRGIAQAQFELDQMSMRLAQMMTGQKYAVVGADGTSVDMPAVRVMFGKEDFSLLELGFVPTFYQFVDTIIEVKVSLSMTQESSKGGFSLSTEASAQAKAGLQDVFTGGGSTSMKASVVGASYASKYQYSAEGSSLVRTKLVPVPPPAILEERIKRLIEASASK